MSHDVIFRLRDLKVAVRELIQAEIGEHQDKEGNLRPAFNEPEHNPQDCLQCRVEDLIR